jgi:transposase-like protein
MMNYARTDVAAWLDRKLEKRCPIIYIDATYWYTRRDNSVSKEAYYTVLAVKEDRTREVLAIVNHPTEGASNWQDVFENLKKRGVEEVNLMVSDGLQGIEDAFKSVFSMADIQLCTVHLARNIQAKVKPEDKAEVAAGLKQVLDPTNKEDTQAIGHKRFSNFIDKWIKKYPSFKCYKEPRYYSYFSYLNYHVEVRRMIYTTNWIERLNRSYKRTLRMRTSMPSPESVVFLIGGVACNRKEFNYPITQFIHETKLFKN